MKKRGLRAGLIVQHFEKKLIFVFPHKCSNLYADVKKQIKQDKLVPPTASETVSLVYAAFQNPDNKYSQEIIKLSKQRYLWAFTGNLYVPNKGIYIQDNPKIKNKKIVMKESDLIEKLEDSEDNSVRFTPFGFKTGEQSSLELAKNPYVKALVGEEGAEKLAEIVDKCESKPYVYHMWHLHNKKIAKMTALGSCWSGYSPDNFGLFHGDLRKGYAYGIDKI